MLGRLGSRLRALTWPRWILALWLVLFVFGSIKFFTATRETGGGPQVRIGADGRYYWAYLTSITLDHDLDLSNQYADPESGNYYGYSKTPTGHMANPFSVGPAILWMPFFAVAHAVSLVVEPDKAASGVSLLHQEITLYASFVYAFAAMLLVYAMARRRFGDVPALVGATAAMLGGPVLHYALNQPFYAHACSAFAVTLHLYLWDGSPIESRSRRRWAALGASAGLAMLVRQQNLIMVLPAAVEGLAYLVRLARRRDTAALRALAPGVALAIVLAFLLVVPQLVVWKVIYGFWIGLANGPGYMRWGQPLWAETLFSSRNGLFPYAPLWALGLCGSVWLAGRERRLGVALLVTMALMCWVNGAADDWSGGGAFGGRRYDALVVQVGLGLALLAWALLQQIERRPRVAGGVALVAVAALGVTCNFVMAEQYRRERLMPSATKDTLGLYDGVWTDMLRRVWRSGNPLSWPGAWAFALRTGAPASRYDIVVGRFFLTDFNLEPYRKRDDVRADALRFGDPGHAPFLVRGFRGIESTSGTPTGKQRPVDAEARFLVPINYGGRIGMELVGQARTATTVHLEWNGHEIATGTFAADAPIRLRFELAKDQVRRGVNVVDLRHDGVDDEGVAAAYVRLEMKQLE
jgi:hypothetical protein